MFVKIIFTPLQIYLDCNNATSYDMWHHNRSFHLRLHKLWIVMSYGPEKLGGKFNERDPIKQTVRHHRGVQED